MPDQGFSGDEQEVFVINLANHCFRVLQSVDLQKLESDGCVVCFKREELEQELQARGITLDGEDQGILSIADNTLSDDAGVILPLVEDIELVISNYFL